MVNSHEREPVIKELIRTIPQEGQVKWIGLRPDRKTLTKSVKQVEVKLGTGLSGDRFIGKSSNKREITLIQEEHLEAVAKLLGKPVDPEPLRRNIVVSGINLLALHNQMFKIGDLVLEGTGYCFPCSKMEEALGPGGYNAMRGHGGITARVVEPGVLSIGDKVSLL